MTRSVARFLCKQLTCFSI